jgi:uncharacterized membrane protein
MNRENADKMMDRSQDSSQRRSTAARVLRGMAALLAVLLVWQLFATVRAPDAMAARSVEWAQFNVDIQLLSDGRLGVTETQVIDFEEGPFTAGSRNIPLGRVDGISNVQISEIVDGQKLPYREVSSFNREPGTYTVTETSSELLINWGFSPTTDESRTFEITYLVEGAVRNYPNEDPPNQQIWWTAISSELTETAPVLESTTSITLTQPVDPAQVVVGTENLPVEPTTTDDQTWTWYATDLTNGDDLTVRIQFPPIVNVATPSWQDRDDEQRAQDEKNEERSALYNLGFLALGGLGAIVGGISLYGLWYTKGRDPQVGPVASFLAHPPGDLPPGAVGVLMDEVADQRDVVATLVDLGNRGVIKLEESKKDGILGFGASSDYDITLVEVPESVRPFETTLLVALFGSELESGKQVKMSDVGSRFQGSSETIKNQLIDEVVERKYFDDEPDKIRNHYRSLGIGALVLAILLGCVGISFFSSTAPMVWLPVIVLGILAVVLIVISSRMPKKTQLGAEEAAKWSAFRTYLADIDKYENIDAHTEIFEKYLPYAIAFGLEEGYTRKFADAGSATPSWYEPVPGGWDPDIPGGRRRGGTGPVIIWGNSPFGGGTWGGSGGSGGSGSGGGVDMPDLQDMSDSASRNLSRSSNSLFGMLTAAAAAFASASASGGGGRSFGGGGGFGGGFSGGGGGFSGGGGSGGGGGGFS